MRGRGDGRRRRRGSAVQVLADVLSFPPLSLPHSCVDGAAAFHWKATGSKVGRQR